MDNIDIKVLDIMIQQKYGLNNDGKSIIVLLMAKSRIILTLSN